MSETNPDPKATARSPRIAPAAHHHPSWNYGHPSGQRGKAERPPPGQGALAEARAKGAE